MQKVWIVGKWIATFFNEGDNRDEYKVCWEFIGVFSSKELALDRIGNERNYFYAPAYINEMLPNKTQEWEGAVYPNE